MVATLAMISTLRMVHLAAGAMKVLVVVAEGEVEEDVVLEVLAEEDEGEEGPHRPRAEDVVEAAEQQGVL